MKKTLMITSSVAAFSLAQSAIAGEVISAPAPAPAASALSGDLSLGYHNQYSFRGVNDLFTPDTDHVVTAELNLAYTLNDQWTLVSGATIRTVNDDRNDFDHNSYRAGLLYTTACCTLELGWQFHDNLFGSGVDGEEIYLNLGTKCPLTDGDINLFIAHDYDVIDGTYVDLSLSKGYELSDTVGIDWTIGISYSFEYNSTNNDFNHAYITAGLPLQVTDNLTVTPYLTYSQGMDALDFGPVDEDDELTIGVSASVGF